MKKGRKFFVAGVFLIGSAVGSCAEAMSADSISTFTAVDGKARTGKLLSMVADTLLISVRGSDGVSVQKKFCKTIFSKVTLFDGTSIDLTKSTWPLSTASEWDDLAQPDTASLGGISVLTGDIVAEINIDGVRVGATPFKRNAIPAGIHTLGVTAPGYEAVAQSVAISARQILERVIVLEHSQAWKDSARVACAKARADSLRLISDTRIARALLSANSIDNLEGMMGLLMSGFVVDTANPKRVAVLPFVVAIGGVSQSGIMASEYAIVNLSARKGITVVERAGFEKMMKELALSQTGIVPEEHALDAGKIMAAQFFVMGSVSEDFGKRLVTVRLVETETGAVISAAAASVNSRDMDAFTRDALGEKVSPSAALFRSAVVPGWGQFYTGHPVQGGVVIAGVLGGAGALVWSVMDWSVKGTEADLYRRVDASTIVPGESPSDWVTRGNSKIAAQNGAATRNVIIGAALGGVWIVNMVDAYLCGVVESKRVRARYFGLAPTFNGREAGWILTLNLNNFSRIN